MNEVLYDVDGHVATLTLNRPDARNSVNPELTTEMAAGLDRTDVAFGLPEVTRGIGAAAGGLFRLPRVIGSARAIELILAADQLGVEEAHRLGMVNHVVDPDEVLARAHELADKICANAPLAVRDSLTIARDALRIDDDEAWRRSAEAMDRARVSEDAREGAAAFVEKRAPRWTGR